MGMPASYSAAYAANAPPAAVPTQAGLVAPEDFHSPTKVIICFLSWRASPDERCNRASPNLSTVTEQTVCEWQTHVHNVHDTLCRVQDAFTNERRINDEVRSCVLLLL